jgi:hypothetical protein
MTQPFKASSEAPGIVNPALQANGGIALLFQSTRLVAAVAWGRWRSLHSS